MRTGTPPAWLVALLEALGRTEWVWKPLRIGIVFALWEIRRQRRQRAVRAAEAKRAADSTEAAAEAAVDSRPDRSGGT